MKLNALFVSVLLAFSANTFAQAPAPVVPAPAPVVAAPIVADAPKDDLVLVPVAEPAAPPQWAENLMVAAQKFPVVGPVLSKILLYLGILSSILTAFIAFLLSAIGAITGALNLAGLTGFADKVQLFKNGKIMYWLKYLSMFNAKKPQPVAASTIQS
jgi:hypothetical protein